MKRSWQISRRSFLRGAGVSMGLPFLEAMLPRSAWAQAEARPLRFLAYFVPNGLRRLEQVDGVPRDTWVPQSEGSDYQLTTTLQPLAPVREHVLVLSGLANAPAIAEPGGDHARGSASFLSAARVLKTEGNNLRAGVSLDQVLARAQVGQSRFGSLELTGELGSNLGGCDPGYSCTYNRNISWSSPTTPVYREVSPRALFDRLFQGGDAGVSAEQRARRRAQDQSILDFVMEDARRLEARLGGADRRKMDEYLTSVRALERQLLDTEAVAPACQGFERPDPELETPERVRQLQELIVLAFQCDLTRTATFMLGNGGSNRTFRFLGLREGSHQLSHHAGDPVQIAKLAQVERWYMEQYVSLIQRLASVQEGDGQSLLDNMLVFMSSEVADGDVHDHVELPVLLAGGAQGQLRSGRHKRARDQRPVADLFLSILGMFGVDAASFGEDGREPLDGLA